MEGNMLFLSLCLCPIDSRLVGLGPPIVTLLLVAGSSSARRKHFPCSHWSQETRFAMKDLGRFRSEDPPCSCAGEKGRVSTGCLSNLIEEGVLISFWLWPENRSSILMVHVFLWHPGGMRHSCAAARSVWYVSFENEVYLLTRRKNLASEELRSCFVYFTLFMFQSHCWKS